MQAAHYSRRNFPTTLAANSAPASVVSTQYDFHYSGDSFRDYSVCIASSKSSSGTVAKTDARSLIAKGIIRFPAVEHGAATVDDIRDVAFAFVAFRTEQRLR
jgi:hypothetical protein